MPSRFPLYLLFAILLSSVPNLMAQESARSPISTDRPSVGTGSDVIAPHSFQIESGLNFAYSGSGYTADLPESLTRFGLGHRMELRFTSTNLMHTSGEPQGSSYFQAQDMNLGLKIGLFPTNSIGPQAIVPGLSFPTGAVAQTSGSRDPSLILVWQQAMHGFTLSENVGAAYVSVDHVRQTNWFPSISVSRSFSSRVSWFAEYATTLSTACDTVQIVDGGFTFTPTPLSQFDIRVGRQSDPTGHGNLLSLGYSFRFDGFLHRPLPPIR